MLPGWHKSVIYGSMLGAIFMSTLDATIVATALPDIIAALGGFEQYAFVATSYLIATVVAIPVTGRLVDLYGRKWFYITGLGIFVLGSLFSGLSRSMTELIIFRGIQGLGAGVMITNAFTLIGDLFTPAERGKYQGYIAGVFGLSSIIGPLAGGFLTDYLGWEWIFFINIPIGIVIILLFLRFLPLIRLDQEQHRIDYAGVFFFVLTIVPLLLALSWGGNQYPWFSPVVIGMLAFSAAMVVVFLLVERRSPEPIVPLSLYQNQVILISVIVTFLLGFSMYSGIIFLPLWFQGVQGESATASGSYLTPMMLGLVVGSFGSGQALSRLGGHYRTLGIIGIVLFAAGMGLLSTLQINTSYVISVLYMVITGFGVGITFPLYSTAIQNIVPYKNMGTAVSAVPFWRFIGAALGLAILGSVLISTFTADFMANLPPSIKSAVPPSALNSLALNPNGLLTSQGQQQLRQLLAQFVPNPDQAYQQVVTALRLALNSAVTRVMFICFVVIVPSLAVQVFLKEVPLRRQH